MSIENIEKKIKDAEEDLAAARLELEMYKQKQESNEPWKPEKGQEYYCVLGDGAVANFKWQVVKPDLFRFSQGNCFKTRAKAEKHRDKLILIAELKEFAGYWKPDWYDNSQVKYCLYYCHEEDQWLTDNCVSTKEVGQIYFNTLDRAQEAIEHFGDRLNLLLEV